MKVVRFVDCIYADEDPTTIQPSVSVRGEPIVVQMDNNKFAVFDVEEVEEKEIIRAFCPDCLALNKKTLLVVENPKEGGKYVCPEMKTNHPNIPYVVWKEERPFKLRARLSHYGADINHRYSSINMEFSKRGLIKYLREWADNMEKATDG